MRTRALLVLVLALAVSSLLATNAAAASHSHGKYREVKKILRDCAKDGKLDHKYSLKALKLALKTMPDDVRDYTDCEKAIKRAIKRELRKRLLKEVKQIYRDCAKDDHLSGHYSLAGLKLALKLLPADLRNYTGCKRAIKKAIKREVRKLKHEVKRIYRDCAKDDDLDGRYSLQGLKLALKWLPDDLRDYTGCEKAIKHAIRHGKYKKHKRHGHHRASVAAVRTT